MTTATLRAIAELMCGNAEEGYFNADFEAKVKEGNYRPPSSYPVPSPCRSSWEIRDLLIEAHVASEADVRALFDARKESARSRFEPVLACLENCSATVDGLASGLERLLCELAAPRTYLKFPHLATRCLSYLNEQIAFEGLVLNLKNGIRPEVQKIAERPVAEVVDWKRPDFEAVLGSDAETGSFLGLLWSDLECCYKAYAYLACMALIGTVLELVLRNRVCVDASELKSLKDQLNINKTDSYLTLEDLSRIAVRAGWMSKEREKHLEAVRQVRNRFVHPQKGRLNTVLRKGDVDICVGVLCATVDDMRAEHA